MILERIIREIFMRKNLRMRKKIRNFVPQMAYRRNYTSIPRMYAQYIKC